MAQKLNDVIVKEATPEKAVLLATFPFGKLPCTFMPCAECLNIRIVEYLPSWFPGLGFKEHAAACRKLAKDVQEQPFEYTKSEVVRD